MANYITLILDTTPPFNPKVQINNGVLYTTESMVNATLTTDDQNTTGYQMLIWGDVNNEHNEDIQTQEEESSWITYTEDFQIELSSGDGVKNIYAMIRDDVHNKSSIESTSITLDAEGAKVTVTQPDVAKISKVSGKDTATFTFKSNKDFSEYKVKVVGSGNSTHDSGVQILTTNGSVNVEDVGDYIAEQVTTVTIKGGDLQTASSQDGDKIIKVFVKSLSGTWSQ